MTSDSKALPDRSGAASISRPVVLASTSRYRSDLLRRLGIRFGIESPAVDETPAPGEAPVALSRRLARQKALAVAKRMPDAIVIGSDQVADFAGMALGKPGNHERALLQLRTMRGHPVTFHTAVSVICLATGFEQNELAQILVRFRDFSDDEAERYLHADEPYDCAGSAKSESLGVALLDSIESDDPTALIGLPLIRTCRMLRAAGIQLP